MRSIGGGCALRALQ